MSRCRISVISISENLEALFSICREEKDFDSERFVGRLLEEQVKSVDEWEGNVEKVKSFSAVPGLIWHLDSIMG
jgi:ferritin